MAPRPGTSTISKRRFQKRESCGDHSTFFQQVRRVKQQRPRF
jgi:hypothetical protein